MSRFAEQHFLITGGSRGIGKAIGHALHERGAHVWTVSRLSEPGFERHHCIAADLRTDVGLRQVLDACRTIPLQGVVFSAGACHLGPVEGLSAEALDEQWQVNLRAPFLLSGPLIANLKQRQGAFVFINSGAGKVAKPDWGAYAATKHGLKALADALRAEVASHRVRVITVYPGRTATDMQRAVRTWEGKGYDETKFVQPEQVADAALLALQTEAPASVDEISIRPLG